MSAAASTSATLAQGSDLWARDIVRAQYAAEVGKEGSPQAIRAIQCVGKHEGSYGRATVPAAWIGSNNWGAIACCKPGADGTCPPGSFLTKDSYPTSSGTNVPYAVCMKSYPTPEAGARDLVRHLTKVRPMTGKALETGDADAIADAMYREHYFGGFGATAEQRKERYAKKLAEMDAAITKATGEGPYVTRKGGTAGTGGNVAAKSSGGAGGLLLLGLGLVVVAAGARR